MVPPPRHVGDGDLENGVKMGWRAPKTGGKRRSSAEGVGNGQLAPRTSRYQDRTGVELMLGEGGQNGCEETKQAEGVEGGVLVKNVLSGPSKVCRRRPERTEGIQNAAVGIGGVRTEGGYTAGSGATWWERPPPSRGYACQGDGGAVYAMNTAAAKTVRPRQLHRRTLAATYSFPPSAYKGDDAAVANVMQQARRRGQRHCVGGPIVPCHCLPLPAVCTQICRRCHAEDAAVPMPPPAPPCAYGGVVPWKRAAAVPYVKNLMVSHFGKNRLPKSRLCMHRQFLGLESLPPATGGASVRRNTLRRVDGVQACCTRVGMGRGRKAWRSLSHFWRGAWGRSERPSGAGAHQAQEAGASWSSGAAEVGRSNLNGVELAPQVDYLIGTEVLGRLGLWVHRQPLIPIRRECQVALTSTMAVGHLRGKHGHKATKKEKVELHEVCSQ
ncbi:hypothetical protein EV363DRAFT_1454501 [Boletus edulis]|nr:hypothetical protein EV363DRAFT_1454501 [Boletus edulis]